MITLRIPEDHEKERKYIAEVLLNEFLGVDLVIHTDQKLKNFSIIILENENEVVIEDHFFSKYEGLQYLNDAAIPAKVMRVSNPFIPEEDLPVIFGNGLLRKEENQIICGIDIFASTFFMLSRWEEHVSKHVDIHGRFQSRHSLAVKEDFINRPVVNEYAEMLWKMLVSLGIHQTRKTTAFQFYLTHDIDHVRKWRSVRHVSRVVLGDVIKRKNPMAAIQKLFAYVSIKLNVRKDPYENFEWIMDKSEKYGLVSRFYFMSSSTGIYDDGYKIYSDSMKKLFQLILKKNHIIGFHPSYASHLNEGVWKSEKHRLEQAANSPLVEGRQHYLRFSVPYTWRIWSNNGMEVDSTCNYAEKEGFRCGTGNEYTTFDVLSRKKLEVKERPLLFMDMNHSQLYQPEMSSEESLFICNHLIHLCKKYKMPCTFLFHNNIFDLDSPINYRWLYENVLRSV